MCWDEFIRCHKNRLDIRRNSLQIIQRAPQHRPHDAEFVLQFLSASIVAFGFDREQIMIKLAHPLLELLHIHRKCSIRILGKRVFIQQIIELNRHSLAMGIGKTESQAAEH